MTTYKYDTKNFISIGGCCLGLYILGKDRIRGPIDNVLLFSYKVVKFIINNTYIDYLKNTPYVKHNKTKLKENEPPVNFIFKNKLKIIHNDFEDEKYLIEIEKREQNFKNFYKKLKTDPHKYFVFSIPYTFVDHGKEIDHRLERLIKYLYESNLLTRTIFVGCHKPKSIDKIVWWDNYLDKETFDYLSKKYNIQYIELNDLDLSTEDGKQAAHLIFKEKIENWTLRKE